MCEENRLARGRYVGSDSPEQIKACLNCTRRECANCFGIRGAPPPVDYDEATKDPEISPELFMRPGGLTAIDVVIDYLNGYSDSEIAKRLGITQQAASAWRRRLGFPAFPLPVREVRRMRDDRENGKYYDELKSELQLSFRESRNAKRW